MQVAFVLYPSFTALDIVGPYQVLSSVPGVDCVFVAETSGTVVDHTGRVAMVAQASIDDLGSPEIVVVPGAGGAPMPTPDDHLVRWLRAVHATTTWTTSVCSGSLYLGAAGILAGAPATSHWSVLELLRSFGAEPTPERVVFADRVVTAAGVSSGIDMALALVGRAWGRSMAEAVQLLIEYDPQPPFDAGSPDKASPATMQQATELLTWLVKTGADALS